MDGNRFTTVRLVAAAAFITAAAPPLQAQVVVLNGPSTIGSDSKAGHALRIVSANSGGARVSITTQPSVALVCDEKTPKTTCYAYVKPGETIRITMRRPPVARSVPGTGAAPTAGQWSYDCVGTTGADCRVTMSQPRTAFVNWGK